MILSDKIRHFFHVVSNVRPIVWIGLYVALVPLFALFYWWLPDSQFRIPDGSGTDYGSWLYYSIVTISTLGFGDYTPAHAGAQAITAVEVMCGLVILGFFLNAVGSMKSEIDVESEIEKQRRVHADEETTKLVKNAPLILHKINFFLAYCYAVTTPYSKRNKDNPVFNDEFTFQDMSDLYKPSELSIDHSLRPAVKGLLQCAHNTSLYLDSLQSRIDLSLWPELLEDCFSFVANCQLFSSTELLNEKLEREVHEHRAATIEEAEADLSRKIATWNDLTEPKKGSVMNPVVELYHFIKANSRIAENIESKVTKIAMENESKAS